MNERETDTDWHCHGWEDHIDGQLAHGRSLTFRQKLEWLEAMGELIDRLRENPAWQARHAAVMGEEASQSLWILDEPPAPVPLIRPEPEASARLP